MSDVLFYDDIVVLNRDVHRNYRVETSEKRFAFTSQTHIVPALADEFAAACLHLPIVFVPRLPHPVPVFLLSLRPGKNAHVNSEGEWLGDYIPAFVRRYPFIFGEIADREPVICIDESYPYWLLGNGSRLFNEDGTETAELIKNIRLVNDYFAASKRNDTLAKALSDLNLLRSITIDAKFENGESQALYGFLIVDIANLEALPDNEFIKLKKYGLLGTIYAHIYSLGCIEKIRKLA